MTLTNDAKQINSTKAKANTEEQDSTINETKKSNSNEIIDGLYEAYNKIDGYFRKTDTISEDQAQEFLQSVLLACKNQSDSRIRQLAGSFLPDFIRIFPKNSKDLLGSLFALCEDQETLVRVTGIRGLGVVCRKAAEAQHFQFISASTEVLAQLLNLNDENELKAVRDSFEIALQANAERVFETLFKNVIEMPELRTRQLEFIVDKLAGNKNEIRSTSRLLTTSPNIKTVILKGVKQIFDMKTINDLSLKDFRLILKISDLSIDIKTDKKFKLQIVSKILERFKTKFDENFGQIDKIYLEKQQQLLKDMCSFTQILFSVQPRRFIPIELASVTEATDEVNSTKISENIDSKEKPKNEEEKNSMIAQTPDTNIIYQFLNWFYSLNTIFEHEIGQLTSTNSFDSNTKVVEGKIEEKFILPELWQCYADLSCYVTKPMARDLLPVTYERLKLLVPLLGVSDDRNGEVKAQDKIETDLEFNLYQTIECLLRALLRFGVEVPSILMHTCGLFVRSGQPSEYDEQVLQKKQEFVKILKAVFDGINTHISNTSLLGGVSDQPEQNNQKRLFTALSSTLKFLGFTASSENKTDYLSNPQIDKAVTNVRCS